MKSFSYLGKGWSFPPAFIKDKGVEMVSEDEDIRQSLSILLTTIPGERVFRYDYGCNIHQWVFGEINLSEKTLIIEMIEQAIYDFEPRIQVERVDIETKDAAEGLLWIDLHYLIPSVNSRRNMVFPFYFREGTNLKNG